MIVFAEDLDHVLVTEDDPRLRRIDRPQDCLYYGHLASLLAEHVAVLALAGLTGAPEGPGERATHEDPLAWYAGVGPDHHHNDFMTVPRSRPG